MINFPENKKIILFDGVCNLCHSLVQFVVKNDKKDVFRFVSLESPLGKSILNHIGIDNSNIDSIVLLEPGIAYYYKSQAALMIAKNLGGLFHVGTIFKLIPTQMANLVYDYVAKNRYAWFGKQSKCPIMSAEMQHKFL